MSWLEHIGVKNPWKGAEKPRPTILSNFKNGIAGKLGKPRSGGLFGRTDRQGFSEGLNKSAMQKPKRNRR